MIKVLLAEDDALYRQTMRQMIPWKQMGFELCGEAVNGLDAWRQIVMRSPQLLITDISMPGMNGVELIRRVKAEHSHIHILVLSAYDDFEYVKEAMKGGAEDYFLKINLNGDMDRFLEILQGIRARIEKFVDKEPQLNRRLQINSLLWYVASGKFANVAEANRSISQAFLSSYFTRYCPMAVQLCEVDRFDLQGPCIIQSGKIEAFEKALYTLEAPEEPQEPRNLVALLGNGRGVCLLNLTGVFSRAQMHRLQTGLFQRMQNQCPEVMIACGGEYATIAKAEEAFQNVYDMIKAHVPAPVLLRERPSFSSSWDHGAETLSLAEAVDRAWSTQCTQALYLLAEALNKKIARCGGMNAPDARQMAMALNKSVFHEAYRLALQPGIRTALPAKSQIACRTIEYLQVHFAEDISIPEIAATLSVNPTYLSNVFRQDTGMRLIECLNRIRLDNAINRMLHTRQSVCEIAHACGFQHVSYFYAVFKKAMGIGVKEYREKSRTDTEKHRD